MTETLAEQLETEESSSCKTAAGIDSGSISPIGPSESSGDKAIDSDDDKLQEAISESSDEVSSAITS